MTQCSVKGASCVGGDQILGTVGSAVRMSSTLTPSMNPRRSRVTVSSTGGGGGVGGGGGSGIRRWHRANPTVCDVSPRTPANCRIALARWNLEPTFAVAFQKSMRAVRDIPSEYYYFPRQWDAVARRLLAASRHRPLSADANRSATGRFARVNWDRFNLLHEKKLGSRRVIVGEYGDLQETFSEHWVLDSEIKHRRPSSGKNERNGVDSTGAA